MGFPLSEYPHIISNSSISTNYNYCNKIFTKSSYPQLSNQHTLSYTFVSIHIEFSIHHNILYSIHHNENHNHNSHQQQNTLKQSKRETCKTEQINLYIKYIKALKTISLTTNFKKKISSV